MFMCKCGARESDKFFPSRPRQCKECLRVYQREYLKTHKTWSAKNPEKRALWQKERRRKLRREVVDGYGGKCKCCGESELVYLVVDHVNNNGALERRSGMPVDKLLYKILREGFPDDYQILCHNCNWAKRMGGCPNHGMGLI